MYKQCVEVYDAVQDPIKYYFVDKIQSALADAETWKVFSEQERKRSSTKRDEEPPEVFHDVEDSLAQLSRTAEILTVPSELPRRDSAKAINLSPQPHDSEEDIMRNNQRARSKKVNIIKRVQAETEQSNHNMNNMVNNYQETVIQYVNLKFQSSGLKK